jgi:hypothetical protein
MGCEGGFMQGGKQSIFKKKKKNSAMGGHNVAKSK